MSTGTIMPSPVFTGFDDNGDPLSAGLLYTYLAGTTTPETTYSDSDLLVPNTNPVVLNAGGRATVFLAAKSYKFILKDALGATIWSQDNISSVLVGQSIGEVFSFEGDPTAPITATSYPVGATIDKTHAGSAVFFEDSANLPGTYVLEGMLLAVGVTVTASLVNLTDGAPDTPLVTISSTSATGQRVRSTAITFAAPGSSKEYAIKVKVSGAGSGYAWGLRLVRTQ